MVVDVAFRLPHLDRRFKVVVTLQTRLIGMVFYTYFPGRCDRSAHRYDLMREQCFFSKAQRTGSQHPIKPTEFFKYASADRHVRAHQAFWAGAVDRLGRSQPGSM